MQGNKRKTLQELLLKDNFMFAAVMMDEENAKGVLERALGMKIDHIEVSYEKTIIFNPEYKGIRLDVFVKDEKNTTFNVEMQVADKKILKRARYYHSQIDMELLGSGIDYEELPPSYVIFICDFDPIGLKKYRYTVCKTLREDDTYEYEDGSRTVLLSTVGENEDEVSSDLVKFLKYAGAEQEESEKDYGDAFVKRLQKSVTRIKFDREMGRRHMLFEEMMKDEYKAGKAAGRSEGRAEGKNALVASISDLLSDIAPVTEHLKERISSVDDLDVLVHLNKAAARAESMEAFEKTLGEMGL